MNIDLHDGTDEQISIIIVHKDRPEFLNICLQSIAVMSFNNNFEIIVVDNASGPESQEFLDEIKDEVKVIRNEKNEYWTAAANKGAEAASKNSKYFVFMHCDVVVLNPGWLDLLISVAESQNSGLVGIEMKSYYLQQQKVDFIEEWCMLVSRECWEDCGPFPKELPQIGPAFIFTVQAQKGGYKPQVMRNPICHHYRIFSLNLNEYERLTESAMVDIPKVMRKLESETVNAKE
jgi:GT2 family glycosyltransferase